jgi:hypothetical protein
MARKSKSGVNVSQAIRDYLKANKDIGPTAAAVAISKQVGKSVSATYVSNIKSTMNGVTTKKGRKGRKPGRKTGRVTAIRAGSNGTVELKTIAMAKELLACVGAANAHHLIDLLA